MVVIFAPGRRILRLGLALTPGRSRPLRSFGLLERSGKPATRASCGNAPTDHELWSVA